MMLVAPMDAPSGVSVVELNVKLGRVPFTPDSNVSAPVPTERFPFSVRLPVPAVDPPAACKFKPPVDVVTMLPLALMVMSRGAATVTTYPVLVLVRLPVAAMMKSRCGARLMVPLAVIARDTVTSWKPVTLILPMDAPCCVSVVELSVIFGRVPLMPESSVSVPVPMERFPLSVRLPVPAVEPLAACKLMLPDAPVVMPELALSVISRCAKIEISEDAPVLVKLPAAVSVISRCGLMVILPLLVMARAMLISWKPLMLTVPSDPAFCTSVVLFAV